MLIWFFNVSAVLYRYTSKLAGADNLEDVILVTINWKDRKYEEERIEEKRSEKANQLCCNPDD